MFEKLEPENVWHFCLLTKNPLSQVSTFLVTDQVSKYLKFAPNVLY